MKNKKAKKIKAAVKTPKETAKEELRAVLFTDGSSIPNPGKAGAGIHGYIYNANAKVEKNSKFGKFLVTNKGYIDSETAVNYIKNYKPDDVRLKVDKAIAQKALFTQEYNYKAVNPISFIEGFCA